MGFSDFVGHEDARLALILNSIEPRCGGVLLAGEKGSGKSTLARLFGQLVSEETPCINVPLNVTEEALVGTIDIESTIKTGKKCVQQGLFRRAHGGIILIDDVNLLSPEAVSLVLEVNGRGENIVEREGLSERHAADFILIATMNPEEGFLSPHFLDRFGMCVFWEGLRDKRDRILVVKKNLANRFMLSGLANPTDGALRDRINSCKGLVKQVAVSSEVMGYIAQTCLENVVSGHRAEVFLFYAAKAYAAYCGDKSVTTSHVDTVIPLVLMHRRRNVVTQDDDPAPERDHERKHQDTEKRSDKSENRDEQHKGSSEKEQTDHPEPSPTDDDNEFNLNPSPRESALREEVFDTGDTFSTKRLAFRKDRLKRLASGRRTKTRSKDKGGRYVRSILGANQDVAIDATIRSAAPHQQVRNRSNILIIQEGDFRYKQREKKTGHLVVFLVDGSGSMGAQKRMTEAKGAIQSLLLDCYQKRDKVALLVFRKDKAEIVLPPTSSVEHASRRLREIPTGGKTPLSAGLLEAYAFITRFAKKAPETRFLLVIITDGRANQAVSTRPVKDEIIRTAQLLRETPSTDIMVVDTENKTGFMRADLAVALAAYLDANYFTIEELKAEYLVGLVKRQRDGS